ncbi:FHA domain-containing protein [Candidatus Woesearchaeota archaeon]|nr:FHA domain-containing protein [Candidatus Woesearchaeota archaeon]
MTNEIRIAVYINHNNKIQSYGHLYGSPSFTFPEVTDEIITLGRAKANDVFINYPFVSNNHGHLQFEHEKILGIFSTSKRSLFYTDHSTNGTYYLPPGIEDIFQLHIKIQHKKVKIDSGCRLVIKGPDNIALILLIYYN